MNFFRALLCLGLFLSAATQAEVKILLEEDFEQGAIKSVPGWGIGSQGGGEVAVVSATDEKNNAESKWALKASYPVSKGGGIYGWASFNMEPYDTREVYIEFNAKMPKETQGIKFLKIFGKRSSSSGYANTTFSLDYTGISTGKGSLAQIGFGDGSGLENDMQQAIILNGNNPGWIGRSYGKAVVNVPERKSFGAAEWGDKWHHFRFKVKFNSVVKNADGSYNEINDGEYYVQIDGRVYVDAKGLLNRHPANGEISKIAFLDWSQNIDKPFEIWYDNIRITTGGFYTGDDPSKENMNPRSN